MEDMFQKRDIAPMLIAENVPLFAEEDWQYELKWDGERCLAYLDPAGETDLRSRRNRPLLVHVPELADLHRQVSSRCVLDGELVCVADGVPSFETIQRRSMMWQPLRIQAEARHHPASFIVFDILYLSRQDLTGLPLADRRERLEKVVSQSSRMARSRVFPAAQAKALYQLVLDQHLEGLVAKRRDSLYFPGKRTQLWKKIKPLPEEDYVICGYLPRHSRAALFLGQFTPEGLRYCGRVSVHGKSCAIALLQRLPVLSAPPFAQGPEPAESQGAVWVSPVLVCSVSCMYRLPDGKMRQPVFRGLRQDKLPEDCRFPAAGQDPPC